MIFKHTDFQVPGFGELEHTPTTTPGYGDALLSLAPAAYWSLGETTGTTLADTVGNHPLTLTDDYTLGLTAAAPSADDGALRIFDGRAAASGAVLPTASSAPFSIVFWVRRVTPGTSGRFIGQYQSGTPGVLVMFILADGRLFLSAGGDPFCVSTAAGVDAWTHAVFTRDGSGNARWYLNGEPDTVTTAQTVAIADVPFALGFQVATAFEAELDEVAVYHKALSAQEVAWLYRAATDRPAPPLGAH